MLDLADTLAQEAQPPKRNGIETQVRWHPGQGVPAEPEEQEEGLPAQEPRRPTEAHDTLP